MAEILFVYITAANRTEAEHLANLLIDEKLAACVNILGSCQSFFEWDGKRENTTETVLTAKTVSSKFDTLVTAVKQNHSYKTPCITAFPVTHGNPEYLDWVKKQVGE